MKQEQVNTYQFTHSNREFTITYRDHTFISGRGFANGIGSSNKEDFSKRLTDEIDATIAYLGFLQDIRKHSEQIAAKHAAAHNEKNNQRQAE